MTKNRGNDNAVELLFKDMYEIHLTDTLRKIYVIGSNKLLTNKSNVISDQEIYEIIDLLHPHYKELKMNITLLKNKNQSFLGMLNPFADWGRRAMFRLAYKGAIAGNHRLGEVTLFPFNYKLGKVAENHKIHCSKLLIVFSLLHEIRHVYQWTYKKKKYNKLTENYINAEGTGYHAQWIERDANKFAQRIMNKNMESINNILEIDFDWDCRWGSFKVDF